MATTSYDAGYSGADAYDVRGGGWITFAAVMLGLGGTFAVLEGILAIDPVEREEADADADPPRVQDLLG